VQWLGHLLPPVSDLLQGFVCVCAQVSFSEVSNWPLCEFCGRVYCDILSIFLIPQVCLFLRHQTMDKVQKHNSFNINIHSTNKTKFKFLRQYWECFRFNEMWHPWNTFLQMKILVCKKVNCFTVIPFTNTRLYITFTIYFLVLISPFIVLVLLLPPVFVLPSLVENLLVLLQGLCR
jgi:hypothetical protein